MLAVDKILDKLSADEYDRAFKRLNPEQQLNELLRERARLIRVIQGNGESDLNRAKALSGFAGVNSRILDLAGEMGIATPLPIDTRNQSQINNDTYQAAWRKKEADRMRGIRDAQERWMHRGQPNWKPESAAQTQEQILKSIADDLRKLNLRFDKPITVEATE